MSDQDALLQAIIAHPDDDTPRLMYADWLDENAPDKLPSPAAGPSARAEYIRVQCRLAQLPFDDPDYPELLERELDLSEWLSIHTPAEEPDPGFPEEFEWYGSFDHGDDSRYARGFPEEFEFTDWEEEPQENIDIITEALPKAFAAAPARTLHLESAYGGEVLGILANPVAVGLRGLQVSYIDDGNEGEAIRGIAQSKHLSGLRRLELEFTSADEELRVLAKAKLPALEHLTLENPGSALEALGSARWFRNLKSLRVWMNEGTEFAALGNLPPMPNLVSLRVHGGLTPTTAAVRRFANSGSFPRLGRLEFDSIRLDPDLVTMLARGKWPLRYLKLDSLQVRKPGAEAIANAGFAESLRVLQLASCEIPASGVQALATSPRLAGLRYLDVSNNPIGASGLAALARSEHLRGLITLDVGQSHSTTGPLTSGAVYSFLSSLATLELRHLRLSYTPVGVRGARLIAAGGTFVNLTRLDINSCGLREAGAKAIVESTALPRLTALNLIDNAVGKGVSKLANPAVHPRLGRCYLGGGNRITGWTLNRLRKRPGIEV